MADPEELRETCSPGRPPPRFLHEAVYCTELDELRRLLAAHTQDVDTRARGDMTPLQLALVANPHHIFARRRAPEEVEVVRVLLDSGADPRLTFSYADVTHYTPLHNVALTGQLELVKLLVEHGAKVDAVDSRGHTPLYDAARCDFRWGGGDDAHVEIVRFLVEHGADVSRRVEGRTAVEVCPDAPGNCPKTCAALRTLMGPSRR